MSTGAHVHVHVYMHITWTLDEHNQTLCADNMAVPDFLSGAMENWGLITYREALLYEPGVTTASTKDWILEVVAHELAHMVSGNGMLSSLLV